MTRQQNRSTRRRLRGGIGFHPYQGGSRGRRSMRGGLTGLRGRPTGD